MRLGCYFKNKHGQDDFSSSVSHMQGVFYFPLLEVRWMLLSFLFAWWYLLSKGNHGLPQSTNSQNGLCQGYRSVLFLKPQPGETVRDGVLALQLLRVRSRFSFSNCFKGTGEEVSLSKVQVLSRIVLSNLNKSLVDISGISTVISSIHYQFRSVFQKR